MNPETQNNRTATQARTTVERTSERELVVTRTVNAPPRIVFEAFTKPDLFQRWWAPKSFGVTFISHEADIRTGGTYRIEMGHPASDQPMAFFGRYLEVTPHARMVWTNDEAVENGSITTITFNEHNGATQIIVHELYLSKEALDEAIVSGSTSGWAEQFDQLDSLITILETK